MRVLIINKFLYPNGGSETYIFKLGEALEQHGHEVQYFGMEHEGRCVGNRVNAYTSVHCQTMNAVNLFYGSVQNGSSNAAGWTNISIKPTPSKIRRAK